jgi:hypothetical protein
MEIAYVNQREFTWREERPSLAVLVSLGLGSAGSALDLHALERRLPLEDLALVSGIHPGSFGTLLG